MSDDAGFMEKRQMAEVQTYRTQIFMAGDIQTAKQWLRRHFYKTGKCVTVSPTDFIYTGGEETGFVIGFVNYPRFPSERNDLWTFAVSVADALIVECCQKSSGCTFAARREAQRTGGICLSRE